jgi:hypothetical protein
LLWSLLPFLKRSKTIPGDCQHPQAGKMFSCDRQQKSEQGLLLRRISQAEIAHAFYLPLVMSMHVAKETI